jgi:hypothetical protein
MGRDETKRHESGEYRGEDGERMVAAEAMQVQIGNRLAA